MDSRWRAIASYRRVVSVGSGPSQYQCRGSKVTSFFHVLSFSEILKIFSKKLHCSRLTSGRAYKKRWLD